MNGVCWITRAVPYSIARPRGHDWLNSEIRNFGNEGVDVLVSLLTPEESAEPGLLDEGRCCRDAGVRPISFPIQDRSIPNDQEARRLVDVLVREVNLGRSIGFHSRAEIGRSSILAAFLLARLGWTVEKAFGAISKARGCHVPDTPEQEMWTRNLVGNEEFSG